MTENVKARNNWNWEGWTFSIDYDGPLSEAGDYTPKYYRIMEAFARYQIPVLKRPPLPLQSRKFAYPTLPVQTYLLYSDILEKAPASNKFQIQDRISMENFPINEGSGQSQGYVLYRKAVNIMGSDVTRFSVWPTFFDSASFQVNIIFYNFVLLPPSGRSCSWLWSSHRGRWTATFSPRWKWHGAILAKLCARIRPHAGRGGTHPWPLNWKHGSCQLRRALEFRSA